MGVKKHYFYRSNYSQWFDLACFNTLKKKWDACRVPYGFKALPAGNWRKKMPAMVRDLIHAGKIGSDSVLVMKSRNLTKDRTFRKALGLP